MAIRFLLNGKAVEVDGVAPTTTLLQWLREHAHLTGTKEGCAEGDCGACTVALADVGPDGEPTWRAVDSCLVFLPALNGRSVLTVEGLGGDHPVQDAMVKHLGSQCGYCTPGFVMSLFEACHRKDLTATDDAGLNDQLCGNLCRCTGYRPIRDAAIEVVGTQPVDGHVATAPTGTATDYVAKGGRYAQPADLAGLFDALDAMPGARIVSGATDLALEVNKLHKALPALVSVESIPSLRGVTRTAGGWRIGATTLLADVEAWSKDPFPSLHRMLRYFASRQIKNRATLGGNVCNASPIGDTPPVLLALDATAILASRAGERRVPLREFFLSYRKTALGEGEVLAAIELPDLPEDAFAASYKVSKRRELDISAVAASFVVRVQSGVVSEARLAYGGMAATPSRAAGAERALVGRPFDEAAVNDAVAALATDFTPMSDHRGTAWYRATLAGNLLRGFYLETRNDRQPTLPARHAGTVIA